MATHIPIRGSVESPGRWELLDMLGLVGLDDDDADAAPVDMTDLGDSAQSVRPHRGLGDDLRRRDPRATPPPGLRDYVPGRGAA